MNRNRISAAKMLGLAKALLAQETDRREVTAKEERYVARQLLKFAEEIGQNAKAMQNWRVPGELEEDMADLGGELSECDTELESLKDELAEAEKATYKG